MKIKKFELEYKGIVYANEYAYVEDVSEIELSPRYRSEDACWDWFVKMMMIFSPDKPIE